MMDNRVVKSTRNCYTSRLKTIVEWLLQNNFGDCIENGKLKLPANTAAIMAFFGYIGDGGLHSNDNGEVIDLTGALL
jgi:hypothetical protein